VNDNFKEVWFFVFVYESMLKKSNPVI